MSNQPRPQGGAYGSGPSARADQKERREVLRNDVLVSQENDRKLRMLFQSPSQAEPEVGTYAAHAASDANSVGGRWQQTNKSTMTGATEAVHYPTLPAASPWHDGNAVEPPLGIDVNETPIVGEPFEVEASIRRLAGEREASGSSSPDSCAEDGTAASSLPSGSVPSTTSIVKRKI
jgi:hypothetical protein